MRTPRFTGMWFRVVSIPASANRRGCRIPVRTYALRLTESTMVTRKMPCRIAQGHGLSIVSPDSIIRLYTARVPSYAGMPRNSWEFLRGHSDDHKCEPSKQMQKRMVPRVLQYQVPGYPGTRVPTDSIYGRQHVIGKCYDHTRGD
eukprot:2680000-Rhodomonas_salina.1